MIPRESDEISTAGRIETRILKFVMHGAFVVVLRKAGQDLTGPLEGWVEEVDTGNPYQFRSVEELLQFLRRRFAESGQKEGSE
jgi:hypothetical protein